MWEYVEPAQNVGTHKGGTILDAVFLAHGLTDWDSSTTILNRDGNSEAFDREFGDSDEDTDHRPLLLVVESDVEQNLDALREAIADMEAALARMKAELARLEQLR